MVLAPTSKGISLALSIGERSLIKTLVAFSPIAVMLREVTLCSTSGRIYSKFVEENSGDKARASPPSFSQ